MSTFHYIPSRFIATLPVPRQYDYQQAQFWDYHMKQYAWCVKTGDPLTRKPLDQQTNVRVR